MSSSVRGFAALAAIVVAGMLAGAGWLLSRNYLEQAAAWSNIIALFVAIIGVGVGVLGLRRPAANPPSEPERGPSSTSSRGRTSTSRRGHIHQTSVAGRDGYNIGSAGTINIHNHEHPDGM